MTHTTSSRPDNTDAHADGRSPELEHAREQHHEPGHVRRSSQHPGQDDQRGRTSRGEAQRRALVQAAYDLIAEEGFEGLRTRGVAARAGVNIATLHYYFATKEDLISAVAEHLWVEFVTVHAPDTFDLTSPRERIRREIVDLEYHLRERPASFIVLFEIVLRSLHTPAISQITRELTDRWQLHFKDILMAGVERGVFGQELDISAVAADIVALLIGNISLAMTFVHAFPVERVYGHIQRWLAR